MLLSLDGIRTHILGTPQHKSLTRMFIALVVSADCLYL